MTAENIDAAIALSWGLVDVVASEGGLDAAVDKLADDLLKCGPEALRAQKALVRQWEELPLTEAINLSVGAFGRAFLTDEPKRLMQAFIDRKR
jgi:enoyl-CoA hydratase/carnithine racemase